MELQPLDRSQASITRFGIMAIDLAQHFQHIAAFAREVLRHVYKLPSSMRCIQSSGYCALSGQRVYLEQLLMGWIQAA
jgi:hypothetical protein